MKIWVGYAAVALIVSSAAVGVARLAAPGALGAFALAAAVALAVQLAAFAPLVALREKPQLVLAAWAGGMLLRMGALLGVGLWLQDGNPVPARPALLTMVALLTLLALMEPLALRAGSQPEGSRLTWG